MRFLWASTCRRSPCQWHIWSLTHHCNWSQWAAEDDRVRLEAWTLLRISWVSFLKYFFSTRPWLSPCLPRPADPREVALRNSPMALVSQVVQSSSKCHIVVAMAEHDSPEFRKQSEKYYKVNDSSLLNYQTMSLYHITANSPSRSLSLCAQIMMHVLCDWLMCFDLERMAWA